MPGVSTVPNQAGIEAPANPKPLNTQGELEAAVSERVSRFVQESTGRGPADIHTYLLRDLLLVRMFGVLTTEEEHLAKTSPPERGRSLIKQARYLLVETARPTLETMIRDVTGVSVLSLHHDISTARGEEVLLFSLAEKPATREAGKRKS